MQPQILYLFDPLCGWCYGFSDTIYKFSLIHGQDLEFVPIPGGMVTGDRVGPISDMEDYITKALATVEERTGCEFGDSYKNGILKSKTTIMNSEPPSRGLITFRTFNNQQSIAFSKALQQAHYRDGKDYNDENLYGDLAEEFGLDRVAYMNRFNDPKMKQQVEQEFAWVKESGVQGFPTVVLRSGQKYFLLSNGFVPIEELEKSLEQAKRRILKEANN